MNYTIYIFKLNILNYIQTTQKNEQFFAKREIILYIIRDNDH